MSVKEFVEKGYLQELNRRFMHPLGLALEAVTDKDKDEFSFGRIWDCRDEKGGLIFDLQNSDNERKAKFRKKFEFIESEFIKRKAVRSEMFQGSTEEPMQGEEK